MSEKRNIALVVGTRPEAIKMFPIFEVIKKSLHFRPYLISTGQHGQILQTALSDLEMVPDTAFELMTPNQSLTELSSRLLVVLKEALVSSNPIFTLVQGDTNSASMGALASYFQQIPIGHVEAGLRTENLYPPFPEEGNRRIISSIASLHFAPTKRAFETLISEGHNKDSVVLTGNSGVDSLLKIVHKLNNGEKEISDEISNILLNSSIILVTCHRRESFGEPLLEICDAIKRIASKYDKSLIVFPVHPNPNVKGIVYKKLQGYSNIKLIDPLPYSQFVKLLTMSRVIITDSGGIQEEAPSIGKRTIVLREVTERQEATEYGLSVTVGAHSELIVNAVDDEFQKEDNNLNSPSDLFGDGQASLKILTKIEEYLSGK